jgi:hypothetical protein
MMEDAFDDCFGGDIYAIEKYFSKYVAYPRSPNPPDCPECNGKLQIKLGRFGEFWGCPSWPKCHGSRSIVKTTYFGVGLTYDDTRVPG